MRSTCKDCRKVKGKTAEKVKGEKGCRGNAEKIGVEHEKSAESNVGSWRARGGEEQSISFKISELTHRGAR